MVMKAAEEVAVAAKAPSTSVKISTLTPSKDTIEAATKLIKPTNKIAEIMEALKQTHGIDTPLLTHAESPASEAGMVNIVMLAA